MDLTGHSVGGYTLIMEWLLVLHLMIADIDDPPSVKFSTLDACEKAAQEISEKNSWLTWIKTGEDAYLHNPVYGPTVFCREDLQDHLAPSE